MHVLGIVRGIAIVFAGLVAGVYLGDRASAPARAALNPSSWVLHQQTVHVYYLWMMPPLITLALLAALVWLFIVKPQWRAVEFWLIAASCLGIVLMVVVTRAVNVPLNEQLMTWNAATPPVNLRELWAPWERADAFRTVVAISVFVFEAVALTLKTPVEIAD